MIVIQARASPRRKESDFAALANVVDTKRTHHA